MVSFFETGYRGYGSTRKIKTTDKSFHDKKRKNGTNNKKSMLRLARKKVNKINTINTTRNIEKPQ